jgi:cytoplasmic iron level regulating protein YaaA (DUF328/UPF0246 family)
MKILLSPAKKMRSAAAPVALTATRPRFEREAQELVGVMHDMELAELGKALGCSGATLAGAARMVREFTIVNDGSEAMKGSPALFTYSGTAYRALDALSLTDAEVAFACRHLRIFSGLYGIVRPQDLLQPYRLDVGNKLRLDDGSSLYDFWTPRVNQALLDEGENELIINLASEEYFKLITPDRFEAGAVLTCSFKEFRDGTLKAVSPAVKTARGLMARYIIRNGITSPEPLTAFTDGGYLFSPDHSSEGEMVFVR